MNYMKEVAQMLGVELYEEFNIDFYKDTKYRFTERGLECFSEQGKIWIHSIYIYRLFTGDYEIVKIPKPILDEAEKEYLSNIIKPFRNCVTSVTKRHCFNSHEIEYISVTYIDRLTDNLTYIFSLPNFKSGTMYKGMESGKHYTLEELGL